MPWAEQPRGWPRIRAQVLAEAKNRCEIGGPNCRGEADRVDHRDGNQQNNARLNLRASCRPCNHPSVAQGTHRHGRVDASTATARRTNWLQWNESKNGPDPRSAEVKAAAAQARSRD